MTIERNFTATDRFGVTVRGSVEVYRPTDPSDAHYGNPRFAYHNFEFLDTREVCTIDRNTLKLAMAEALRSALEEGLGIREPGTAVIEQNVNEQIGETLQRCARHPHQFSSNQPSLGADRDNRVSGDPQTARAYQMAPDPQGQPPHQLARSSNLGLVGRQDQASRQPEGPPTNQSPFGPDFQRDGLAPGQAMPAAAVNPQSMLSNFGLGTPPQPFQPAPDPGFPQHFRPDYEPYYPPSQFTPHPLQVPGPPVSMKPSHPDDVFRGGFDIQSILPQDIRASFGPNAAPTGPTPVTPTEPIISLLSKIGSLPPPQGLLGPLPAPPSLPLAHPYAGIASIPGLPSGLARSLGLVPATFNGFAPVDPDQPSRLLPYGIAP